MDREFKRCSRVSTAKWWGHQQQTRFTRDLGQDPNDDRKERNGIQRSRLWPPTCTIVTSQAALLMTLVRRSRRLRCTTTSGCLAVRESVTSLASGGLEAKSIQRSCFHQLFPSSPEQRWGESRPPSLRGCVGGADVFNGLPVLSWCRSRQPIARRLDIPIQPARSSGLGAMIQWRLWHAVAWTCRLRGESNATCSTCCFKRCRQKNVEVPGMQVAFGTWILQMASLPRQTGICETGNWSRPHTAPCPCCPQGKEGKKKSTQL